jgi:hypothetical protein
MQDSPAKAAVTPDASTAEMAKVGLVRRLSRNHRQRSLKGWPDLRVAPVVVSRQRFSTMAGAHETRSWSLTIAISTTSNHAAPTVGPHHRRDDDARTRTAIVCSRRRSPRPPHTWLSSPAGKVLHAGGCRSRAHGCTRRSRASETRAAFFGESCIAPGRTTLQESPPRSLKVGLNWADAWRGWRARNPENGESRGSHLSRGTPQGRGKPCGRRSLAAPDCRSCGVPRCWRSTVHQDRTSGRGWAQFSDSC